MSQSRAHTRFASAHSVKENILTCCRARVEALAQFPLESERELSVHGSFNKV